MKKGLMICVTLYLLIAIVMIIFHPTTNQSVSVLVVERFYAQNITRKSETLDIIFYLSEKDSFLTTKEQMTDLRIIDQDTEMSVEIVMIEDMDTNIRYLNEQYSLYALKLAVGDYIDSGLKIHFREAKLMITYTNDYILEALIGEVVLCYFSIEENPDFDFYKLSANYINFGQYPIMESITLGLDQFESSRMTIHSISIGSDFIRIESPQTVGLKPILSEEDLLCEANLEESFLFQPNVSQVYTYPIRYTTKIVDLWRFPLIIDYSIDEARKLIVIDDFMFKSTPILFWEDKDVIHRIIYNY
jgi:hypothetical protein